MLVVTHTQVDKNAFGIFMKKKLVLNDTMLVLLKFNKYRTCGQKITNTLTNERRVLIDSYSCTNVSCLLNFDTNDAVSFEINIFS